jgi:dimeric dUTPase (all-alpha-NTP-PPase superfamily)
MEGVFKHMNNLHIIIDELSIMQSSLEQHVQKRFGISDAAARDYIAEKLLALKVELGELANETRCFKFWSTKEKADQPIILEELVDNIHFALSIGLPLGYLLEMDTGKRLYYPEVRPWIAKKELTCIFNDTFNAVAQFEQAGVMGMYQSYIIMLQALLNLAAALGFSEQDLYEGYVLKNNKNHERQEAGY